jgi:hypothetical protein
MEKSKNINRFRDWYKLIKKFGKDGDRLMSLEHRFWKFFWNRKNLFRFQNKQMKKAGKFKIIPEYTTDEEKKQLKAYSSSFLKGKERELSLLRHLYFLQRNRESILSNLVLHLKLEGDSEILGLFLTGSVFFGPRKEAFDKDSDIDLFCLVTSNLFTSHNLRFRNDYSFYLDGEKKKIQIFFVGEKIDDKPGFLPIHFLATPNIEIYNRLDGKKFNDLKSGIVSDTINEIDDLENLINSFEATLQENKKEKILE